MQYEKALNRIWGKHRIQYEGRIWGNHRIWKTRGRYRTLYPHNTALAVSMVDAKFTIRCVITYKALETWILIYLCLPACWLGLYSASCDAIADIGDCFYGDTDGREDLSRKEKSKWNADVIMEYCKKTSFGIGKIESKSNEM